MKLDTWLSHISKYTYVFNGICLAIEVGAVSQMKEEMSKWDSQRKIYEALGKLGKGRKGEVWSRQFFFEVSYEEMVESSG